jgi:diaminohydroxyphosphoribosylaminopyrimidine deaminase/5-amino-6-(5-phosphoribosylamino)uracil reductase
MTFATADYTFMSRAIQLADRGLFTTDPNPRVGCVIVANEKIVGEGWHKVAGGPHAEINALRASGDKARGATAYVSLEPCCHYGKTGPCADALIESGVARVVAAMLDPSDKVAGKGIERLQQHGIQVQYGLLQARAEALNPGFIKRVSLGRPWVRCKMAMTLDGRTAAASGESQWISDEPARLDVQRLRARSSAILSGINTVLADDPSLNVRIPAGETVRQPLRVVVDSQLKFPPEARMLALPGETVVVTVNGIKEDRQQLQKAGATVVVSSKSVDDRVDLEALLGYLAHREVNEVLLECGPTLSGAMIEAGLVDEFVFYVAPHLLGSRGRGLFHLPSLHSLQDRVTLSIADIRQVGPDLRITALPDFR